MKTFYFTELHNSDRISQDIQTVSFGLNNLVQEFNQFKESTEIKLAGLATPDITDLKKDTVLLSWRPELACTNTRWR